MVGHIVSVKLKKLSIQIQPKTKNKITTQPIPPAKENGLVLWVDRK